MGQKQKYEEGFKNRGVRWCVGIHKRLTKKKLAKICYNGAFVFQRGVILSDLSFFGVWGRCL
jgi:hypothetical protein